MIKKNYTLLFIAFLFYLIGHVLWTFTIICDEPILLNECVEKWLINVPFFIFTIIGLIATYRLYKSV